jgi:hypothetical protein
VYFPVFFLEREIILDEIVPGVDPAGDLIGDPQEFRAVKTVIIE